MTSADICKPKQRSETGAADVRPNTGTTKISEDYAHIDQYKCGGAFTGAVLDIKLAELPSQRNIRYLFTSIVLLHSL